MAEGGGEGGGEGGFVHEGGLLEAFAQAAPFRAEGGEGGGVLGEADGGGLVSVGRVGDEVGGG